MQKEEHHLEALKWELQQSFQLYSYKSQESKAT